MPQKMQRENVSIAKASVRVHRGLDALVPEELLHELCRRRRAPLEVLGDAVSEEVRPNVPSRRAVHDL